MATRALRDVEAESGRAPRSHVDAQKRMRGGEDTMEPHDRLVRHREKCR